MKNSIAAMTAAVLLAATALTACSDQKPMGSGGPGSMPKARVGVISVEPMPVTITSELSGRTTASKIAEVRPQVGGIVRERLFTEGVSVKEGEPLYMIDPVSYEITDKAARASLSRALAELPAANARLERVKGLHDKSVSSLQELEEAVAAEKKARADVEAAEAQLMAAETDLARTRIKAPISGIAGRSALTEGALVSPGQAEALTVIRQIDPINVDVAQSSVEFHELGRAIREGRITPDGGSVKVRLRLEDGTEYGHPGTLRFTESDVDPSTGMVRVRASFPNPEGALLPGMFVRAVVEQGTAERAILVPQRAVSRNVKGEPTALIVKDGRIEQRVLKVDGESGNSWIVLDGVAEGESVVVEGSMKAKPGQEVDTVSVAVDPETGLVVENQAGSN
jgi:membrane fusion protein (multidrug efflux system)